MTVRRPARDFGCTKTSPLPGCRLARHSLAHGERAGVEIDRLPGQAERLALTQAEGQGHRPAGGVPLTSRRLEHPPSVLAGQRLELLALDACGIDQGADVPRHIVALHCHLQRPGWDAVGLEDRGWRQVGVMEVAVEPLDVLGLQRSKRWCPMPGISWLTTSCR